MQTAPSVLPKEGIPLPLHQRRLQIAAVLLIAVCVFFLWGFPSGAHVVHEAAGVTHPTQWVWVDAISQEEGEKGGRFEGEIVLPASHTLWLENTSGAAITLTMAGQRVYEGNVSSSIVLPADAPPVVSFQLDYTLQLPFPKQGYFGLMQDGLFGLRSVVPAWQFASKGRINDNLGMQVARGAAVVAGIGAVGLAAASLRLTRRERMLLALIFLLGLTIQVVVLTQKLSNNPGLWSMDDIWDNYVRWGRAWLAGYNPLAGQEYQQGNFIYMGLAQLAFGPYVIPLYWLNTLLATACPVIIALAGWVILDRKTGYTAGVIAAVFAPLLHYEQSLQPEAILILFTSLLVLTGCLFYRRPNLAGALVCGLLIGLCTLMRGSMLLLLLWPLLLLLIMRNIPIRRRAGYALLVAAGYVFALLPIVITNFNAGNYILTPSRSDIQLFRANNRDSTGLNSYLSQSERLALARGENWTDALKRDIQRDPGRLVELTLRRFGLFWASEENSDFGMVDYKKMSLQASPLLQTLSLNEAINFRLLAVLALAGFGILWIGTGQRKEALVIASGAAVYLLTLVIFYVTGRLRIQASVWLILLAASLIHLPELRPITPRKLAYGAAGLVAVAALLLASDRLVAVFPRPEIISESQIPSDTVAVQATYGGEIRLMGYQYYDSNYHPGGYVTFELYWKTLKPPSEDYTVTFRLVNPVSGEVVDIYNAVLGTTDEPQWSSTHWQVGDVFDERYTIKLPDQADTRALVIFVGLYSTQTNHLIPLTDGTGETRDDHIRLTAVGLRAASENAGASGEPAIVWQDDLGLQSAACQITGGKLGLKLDWSVQQRPAQDWHFFIHVFQGDQPLGQFDGALLDDVPTDGLIPGDSFTTQATFENIASGSRIEIGFYDPATLQRQPITRNSSDWSNANDTLKIPCS